METDYVWQGNLLDAAEHYARQLSQRGLSRVVSRNEEHRRVEVWSDGRRRVVVQLAADERAGTRIIVTEYDPVHN